MGISQALGYGMDFLPISPLYAMTAPKPLDGMSATVALMAHCSQLAVQLSHLCLEVEVGSLFALEAVPQLLYDLVGGLQLLEGGLVGCLVALHLLPEGLYLGEVLLVVAAAHVHANKNITNISSIATQDIHIIT